MEYRGRTNSTLTASNMKDIRMAISKLNAKRVPALSLIVVAMLGMVAGVLAATTITVTQKNFSGESGTYHNNSNLVTATDQGLTVIANSITAATGSATFGGNGSDVARNTALTAGNWMAVIVFTTSLTDSSTHTATVTIRTGSGASGSTILVNAQTLTLVAPGASSTGTVTLSLDLGSQSLAGPLTVYVTVS